MFFIPLIAAGIYLNLIHPFLCQATGVSQGGGAVALFVSGLLAAFAWEKFKDKRQVLEEAYSKRGDVLTDLVREAVEEAKRDRCQQHVTNAYSQMNQPGNQGLQALNGALQNILEELKQY